MCSPGMSVPWPAMPVTWPPAAVSGRPDMPAARADSEPAAQPWPLVQVLAFPGCPNRDAAIALAERVCQELGCNAEIQVLDVADQQAAERTRAWARQPSGSTAGMSSRAPPSASPTPTAAGSTPAGRACAGCRTCGGSARRCAQRGVVLDDRLTPPRDLYLRRGLRAGHGAGGQGAADELSEGNAGDFAAAWRASSR